VKGDTSRPLQFYPSLNQHSPLTAHHRKEPPHHRPSGAFITLTTYSSGRIAFQWEDGIFQMAVSGCFYGAPGEIRTPDLVVRSHALESALQPINAGISLQRLSNNIWKIKE